METFSQCKLTDAGKPRLVAGEVELCVATGISLRAADRHAAPPTTSIPRDTAGIFYVTTHRIFWLSPRRDTAFFNSLSPLAGTSVQDVSRLGAHRLVLRYGRHAGIRVDVPDRETKERVDAALAKALHRAEWTRPPPPAAPVNPYAAHGGAEGAAKVGQARLVSVGVAGAIRAQRRVVDESAKEIGAGFASLVALEERADALVQIAKRYKTLRADPEGNEEHNKLLNMMTDMCIDSPVTKETTGNNAKLYRRELAGELSSNLRKPVVEVGGIMTIADAYCLINRIRATTEYVSPDDFVAALAMFKAINSRLTVFELDSGVRALKVDMSLEPDGLKKVAAMAEEDGRSSISALEVMQKRSIPVQTALDLLISAEISGLLARDETTAGVRFFPNKFPAFYSVANRERKANAAAN